MSKPLSFFKSSRNSISFEGGVNTLLSVSILAVRYLESHCDADAIAVVGVDEPAGGQPRAVVALVAREPFAGDRGRRVVSARFGPPSDAGSTAELPATQALAVLLDAEACVLRTEGGTAAATLELEAKK